MGIDQIGQVVLMIHCGSRGFGHQVATDALVSMEKAMKRDKIEVNDRQLACARINSKEGMLICYIYKRGTLKNRQICQKIRSKFAKI